MPENPPIALILFSNDLDAFLPNVEKERKLIEEALEHYDDTNRLKVITRSSVNVEEVFRLFSRYKGRITLFHFAGHAGGEGLQFNKSFEDTEMGKAVGLVDLFKKEVEEGLLQLVFLNGCSTNPQLELLKEAGVPSVISTRHPIDDEKAFQFANQFYRTLASTDHPQPFESPSSIEAAFEQALAFLKTLHPVSVEKKNRDVFFSFSENMDAEEAWALYTANPAWTLSAEVAEENKPFNELLTHQLMEALQAYSKPAEKFAAKVTDMTSWESVARISDTAKDIIAYSYVGVIGIQLRKLFAIGKEELSENKQRKYISNCILTSKRALQLISFAVLSRLWDYQKEKKLELTDSQSKRLQSFFEDQFELDILGYLELLRTLCAIFSDKKLDFPLPELEELIPELEPESDFVKSCERLQQINVALDKAQFSLADCFSAERQLTFILRQLAFLAAYRMVSIKDVAYDEMRNSPPRYLHSYTALGVDSKRNINAERINYAESPINTHAILLFKGRYLQSINLFPFVIDLNALTYEGGSKVCFYSCQDIADSSLNYRFMEDNILENIIYKKTKTEETNLNQLMMDQDKRKDFNLDFVFLQFQEAKKTVLQSNGVEENDFFDEEEDAFDF